DGGERARVMLGPSVAIERIPGSRTLMPTTACGLCGRLEWTAIERRASAAGARSQRPRGVRDRPEGRGGRRAGDRRGGGAVESGGGRGPGGWRDARRL